jgi:hypothetical protein
MISIPDFQIVILLKCQKLLLVYGTKRVPKMGAKLLWYNIPFKNVLFAKLYHSKTDDDTYSTT